VSCSVNVSMEHKHPRRFPLCKTTNIHRFLRGHEEYINDNRNSIFIITSMMHPQEEVINTKFSFILETPHNQKRQIEELQAKCDSLQQLIVGSNAMLSIRFVAYKVN